MMMLLLVLCWMTGTVEAASLDKVSDIDSEVSFKEVLSEVATLPAVESQVTIQNQTQEMLVSMLYDNQRASLKHTTVIPEGELTSGMTLVVYMYENGVEVSDMVQLLESTVAWTSTYDPNYADRVQAIADKVAGRLVQTETSEDFTGFHLQDYRFYLNPTWEFSDFVVDEATARATVDLTNYLAEQEAQLLTYYPEGTQFKLILTADKIRQTLSSELTIDIDEDLQKELYANQVYATLQSVVTDTVVRSSYQASDEQVPALEDLETISLEEYEKIARILQQ